MQSHRVSSVFGVAFALLLGVLVALPAPMASAPQGVPYLEAEPVEPGVPAPLPAPAPPPVDPDVDAIACVADLSPTRLVPRLTKEPLLRFDGMMPAPDRATCVLPDEEPQASPEPPPEPEAAEPDPLVRPEPIVWPALPAPHTVVAIEDPPALIPPCNGECMSVTEYVLGKVEDLQEVLGPELGSVSNDVWAPPAESMPESLPTVLHEPAPEASPEVVPV